VVLHNPNYNYQWWYSCGKWNDTWSSVCVWCPSDA